MRSPPPLELQEKIDPRDEAATCFGIDIPPSTVAFKRVATGNRWRTIRRSLFPMPPTTAALEGHWDLKGSWVKHYKESFRDPEDTLFQDEVWIELHIFEQWRLTYNNTFALHNWQHSLLKYIQWQYQVISPPSRSCLASCKGASRDLCNSQEIGGSLWLPSTRGREATSLVETSWERGFQLHGRNHSADLPQ